MGNKSEIRKLYKNHLGSPGDGYPGRAKLSPAGAGVLRRRRAVDESFGEQPREVAHTSSVAGVLGGEGLEYIEL